MAANIYVNEIELEPEMCVIHSGERVNAVCNSCEEPVCIQCLLGPHNGHSITDIQEAREEVRESLLRHRRALKHHIRSMEGQVKEMKSKEAENERECDFTLDSIKKSGNVMRSQLAQVLKTMENDVRSRQEQNQRELLQVRQPLEERLKSASTKLTEVDLLINSDNMYNTLHLEQELRRFTEDHQNGTHIPNIQIPKFQPNKITKEDIRDKLGELVLSGSEKEEEEDDHVYDYVEPAKSIPVTQKSVKREDAPKIKAPHKKNDNYSEYIGTGQEPGFCVLRKTKLSEGAVNSICPLTKNQGWMTDESGKSLRLISERGHTIRSVTANTKKSDIALTSDGAVLMTCPDKCCIKKYSQDSTIRIFINTPDFFPHGICIHFLSEEIFVGLVDSSTYDVKSDSHRFIQRYSRKGEPLQQFNIQRSNSIVSLTFGKKTPLLTIPHKVKVNQSTSEVGLVNWTKDTQGQVVVFMEDGRKKFTYPSETKTPFEPMDMVFTTSNHIIVCDAVSRSLQVVDDKGKFVKVLHSFDKVPTSLAYFGMGQLWVGTREGEVFVTSFTEEISTSL